MKLNMMLIVVLLLVSSSVCLCQEAGLVKYQVKGSYSARERYLYLTFDKPYSTGFDGEFKLSPNAYPNSILIGIYKTMGIDGWDWDTGFYTADHRPPLNPGQTLTFNKIYVWADPTVPAGQDILLSRNIGLKNPNVTYKLTLVSTPAGVSYSGPWEWGADHDTIVLPFFSTDDGTKGYEFKAEFTVIPEPSSLLALFGGLAGLGGVALKRRR